MDTHRKQKLDAIVSLIQDVFSGEKKLELLRMLARCMSAISDDEIGNIRMRLRDVKSRGKSKVSNEKVENAYQEIYESLRIATSHANDLKKGRLVMIEQHQRDLKMLNRKFDDLGMKRRNALAKVRELDGAKGHLNRQANELQGKLKELNITLTRHAFKEKAELSKKIREATTIEEKTWHKREFNGLDKKIDKSEAAAAALREKIDDLIKGIGKIESNPAYVELKKAEQEIKKLLEGKENHRISIQKLREEIGQG